MDSKDDAASMRDLEEMSVPEAIRVPSETRRVVEASMSRANSRRSPMVSPGARSTGAVTPRTRLRKLTSTAGYVPWWALLASALCIAGIVTYALKGSKVGTLSMDFFDSIGSSKEGFVQLLDIYDMSFPATLGAAGGVVLASMVMAICRINQKLRKDGKAGKSGPWGKATFSLLRWLSIFMVLFTLLAFAWFVYNSALLASWGLGVWAVRDGCTVATQTLGKMSTLSSQLADFADSLKSTVPAKDMKKLNATINEQLSALGAVAPMPNTSALVPGHNGVCPSASCLNLGLYNYLESENCACTEPFLTSLHDQGDEILDAIFFALIGIGCMLLGAWVAAMQLVAGLKLMEADQVWLRVVRRRSSARPPSSTPPRMLSGSFHNSFHDKQFMVPPTSASRRLPYASPPVYHVHSDSRSQMHMMMNMQ